LSERRAFPETEWVGTGAKVRTHGGVDKTEFVYGMRFARLVFTGIMLSGASLPAQELPRAGSQPTGDAREGSSPVNFSSLGPPRPFLGPPQRPQRVQPLPLLQPVTPAPMERGSGGLSGGGSEIRQAQSLEDLVRPFTGLQGEDRAEGLGGFLPQPSPQLGIAESAPERPAGELKWYEQGSTGSISLHADRVALGDVLRLVSTRNNLNLVLGQGVNGEVTLSLQNATLEEVLDAATGVCGASWNRQGNLLFVTMVESAMQVNPRIQGRVVKVFPLNFVSAIDVQKVAEGLLSPAGQAFIVESDSADPSKTQETLVVEDLPESIARIAAYVSEIDQAPRQVLIEAHILQVLLDEGNRHGVNLNPLLRVGTGSITFATLGFANEEAQSGMKISVDGTDIQSIVELIQTCTDSRTLASPKVLAINRQESNIQIGKRLSYLTTTTTQTAAVQTVQFLDTGVVLRVTPIISEDNQILMQISPKVSGGQLNAETDLPEEESTELSTAVLLPDGGGVIIGGLIKEENFDSESRVPGLSRIPLIGFLFKRVEKIQRKSEIIVALVARIQSQPEAMRVHEHLEMQKAVPPYASIELSRPIYQNGAPVPQ